MKTKTSAGLAIIYDNKVLLAHTTSRGWYGSYGIPKGGIEKGESKLDAAIRETEEEVGIKIPKKLIDPTEHTFVVSTKKYGHKIVYYYIVKIDKIEQKGNNRRQLFFRWENIKDDFIPFLELLNENYTLESYSPEDKSLVIDSGDTLVFTPSREWIGNKKRWYNIEELINDSIDDNDKFQFISFVITGEK